MKLKLEAKLCRIKGNSSETILDEFEDFEKQMRRTEVPTWKRIYRYFEAALDDRPKEWIEGVLLTSWRT